MARRMRTRLPLAVRMSPETPSRTRPENRLQNLEAVHCAFPRESALHYERAARRLERQGKKANSEADQVEGRL